MPEGDTIWRTAETLRGALQDKRIADAKPDTLKRFKGRIVTDVKPVGKHLLIRFDNGLAIHSHMRMQGAWHVYNAGEPWRRPQWQAKALLQTEDGTQAVCFSAPTIELVKDENTKLGHLGPDILTEGWDIQEVIARARKHNTTPIGELLLDQRVTAGIGNIHRCEALYQTQISPFKPTKDLTDGDLKQLFEAARQNMQHNLHPTAKTTTTRSKPAVHARAGRPCPRCGTRIRVRAQGEHARLVYWCPACQT